MEDKNSDKVKRYYEQQRYVGETWQDARNRIKKYREKKLAKGRSSMIK